MLDFFKDEEVLQEEDEKKELPTKVAFTVTIPHEYNEKFNEIMAFYQSKHKYGRVYKNQVLQLIIDEAHTKLKSIMRTQG